MGGKKGRSGRKPNFNDEYHRVARKLALEYYYKHKKERARYMREYHKKNLEVLKYAGKHKISIPEARKIVGNRKTKETEK